MRDGRFLYTVLCCRYGGAPEAPGPLLCCTGALPQDRHPESREYLLHLAGQLQKRAKGLSLSGRKTDSEDCRQLSRQILALAEQGPVPG